MTMNLKATIEREIDIDDVMSYLLDDDPCVYNWWDNYEKILDNFDLDERILLEQNPLPVLKACIGLYADHICDYAENDLEGDINFNHGKGSVNGPK